MTAPSISDFVILKPISRGKFGKVFLGARKTDKSTLYAIKIMSKDAMKKKNLARQAIAERNALAVSKCSYIIHLYYSLQSETHIYLIMEYLIGGDIKNLLMVVGYLGERHAAIYTAEITIALRYLHEHGIIHRDLKPDNILITAKGHLKLTDFGLSTLNWTRDLRPADVLYTPSVSNLPSAFYRTPGQVISLTSDISFMPNENSCPKDCQSVRLQNRRLQSKHVIVKFALPDADSQNREAAHGDHISAELFVPDPRMSQLGNLLSLKTSDLSSELNGGDCAVLRHCSSNEWLASCTPLVKHSRPSETSNISSLRRSISALNLSYSPPTSPLRQAAPALINSQLNKRGEIDTFPEELEANHHDDIRSGLHRNRHQNSVIQKTRMFDATFGQAVATQLNHLKLLTSENFSNAICLSEMNPLLPTTLLKLPLSPLLPAVQPLRTPRCINRQSRFCLSTGRKKFQNGTSSRNFGSKTLSRFPVLATTNCINLRKTPARLFDSSSSAITPLHTACPHETSDPHFTADESNLSVPKTPVPRLLGTPDYLAPELLQYPECRIAHDNPAIDWWALGVILFEMLTGVPPFSDETPEAVFHNILNLDIPWPVEEADCPADEESLSMVSRSLISGLLSRSPSERMIVAKKIHQHAFFDAIGSWDQLDNLDMPFVPCPDDDTDTAYFQPRNTARCYQMSYSGCDLQQEN